MSEGRTPITDEQAKKLPKLFGRKPDFVIGSLEDPYLCRWWITPRNRIFQIYIHKIMKSDDDRALHDHPWFSMSFLLKGAIGEIYGKEEKYRAFKRFVPLFRSGKARHRLVLTNKNGFAWTLFVVGPNYRRWGFHTPKGWVYWKTFLGE